MADSIFDNNDNVVVDDNNNIFGDNNQPQKNPTTIVSENSDNYDDNVYSSEELNDPQTINVTIADNVCPLVVLFGPPACGKTMTMVRLTRYLNLQGYEVSPIRNFRPAHDKNYAKLCDSFDELINSDDAAESTNKINFMLVQVVKNGKRICQLLEAPGEFYFDTKNPNAPFVNFINTILSKSNRKIFSIMVEPDWMNASDRKNYVNRIVNLKKKMRPRDRTIIVFNKIDKTSFVTSPGHIHKSSAIKEVNDLYPGIFTPFVNVNPISRLWRAYDCKFIGFQTGDYSMSASGKQTFQEGPEEYPRNLWKDIMSSIQG